MLQEINVRSGFFDGAEFEAVRGHLPADVQPVVTFAYVTGWRVRSEILPIEWRHVDREAGAVRLDPGTTKNGEGRLLPFGDRLPELRDMLRRAMAPHEGRRAGPGRDYRPRVPSKRQPDT